MGFGLLFYFCCYVVVVVGVFVIVCVDLFIGCDSCCGLFDDFIVFVDCFVGW